MIGKGNGAGSRVSQFVAKTSCSRCSVSLTPETRHFGKCKPCAKADHAVARAKCTPSAVAVERRMNRDRTRGKDPARRAANAPRVKAWTLANRERANAGHAICESRRRARKALDVGNVSLAEWREQLGVFDHRCGYCLVSGVKLQMEHVLPIARGGPHTIENVVPACGPCNNRKYARGPLSMVNRPWEGTV